MESAARYGVLGRKTACSTERIEVPSGRSNAVILYTPSLLYVESNCDDIWNQKVSVSPPPPPTISHKNNCTCDLDSKVARSSKDIQRIELKPNTQLSNTRRLVTRWREETLERTKFDRDTLNQEKHGKVTDPTSTVKPVSGHESTKRCVFDTQTCWKWSNRYGETRHGGHLRV